MSDIVYNPFTNNFDFTGNGGAGGDVEGPASSTDENVAIFDGTTGKIIKDGGVGLPQNDGELIFGNTAGDAQIGTLTAGDNITITNTAGGATISADSGGQTELLKYWKASDFDVTESNFAPLFQDNGTNVRQLVRAFDDTTEEFVNFSFSTGLIDSGDVTFRVYMYAATAAADNVQIRFGYVDAGDNDSWDQSYTNLDSGDITLSGTQDQVTVFTTSVAVGTLGWTPEQVIIARLSRIAPSTSNLTGDLRLIGLEIKIPQSAVI